MEKKSHVLMIHNAYQISGGEDTVVAQEKELLEQHGHKVVLYSRSNDELKQLSLLQKASMPFQFVYRRETVKEVREIIRRESIDLMYVHNTFPVISPSVYDAAIREGIPVIQTIHNFRLFCPGALLYRNGEICEECIHGGLRCALKYGCYHGSKLQTMMCCLILWHHRRCGTYQNLNYICLTEFSKQKFLDGMQEYIHPEQVYVKPNYVADLAADIGERPESAPEKYYLYLGRLSIEKGIDQLIKAWPKSLPEPLLVAGDGPLKEELAQYLEEHPKNVRLLGALPRAEALRYVRYAQAQILASVCYENLSMSLVESMMCGTPLISNRVGNSGAIVSEIAPELVIDIASTSELAAVLSRFRKEDYTEAFRSYYLEHYTAEQSYTKLSQIMEQCIGRVHDS